MTDQSYRSVRVSLPLPRTTFSYYGGKSKIAQRYPPPRHARIVEPFGGAAAYAWLHRRGREVWVNDIDPITCAIWRFLQAPDATEMLAALPPTIAHKQEIATIAPWAPEGLRALIVAELSRGSQGRRDTASRATAFGAHYYWPRFAARFSYIVEEIAGWRITNHDYQELPNLEATWFVDPPYDNAAGQRYRHAALDYAALGAWARARVGQVIVCENVGASWLPFRPLVVNRIGRHARTTNVAEAIYEQPAASLFDVIA